MLSGVGVWRAAVPETPVLARQTHGVAGHPLDVTVVLPCLDEEASVGLCVAEAAAAIERAGWSGEVVVVDNGSRDRSAVVAREAGARIVTELTAGYGAAILAGIGAARGSVVVMADADCTYPLDRLAEIVRPVAEGQAGLVLASRLDGATGDSMPRLHRMLGTPVLTWLVREGTGIAGLSDSQSGFRAFGHDLAQRLGLRATGMEFASEMLIKAAEHDVAIREVALGYRARVGQSKLSTWRDGRRHLRLILSLSPHLLLWWPGVAAMTLGVLTYALTLAGPSSATVGSLTWQPIFFGTILLVVGLLAALSGALLARYHPSASRHTRDSFAWVSDPVFVRRAVRTGVGLAATALAVDGFLAWLWLSGAAVNPQDKLHVASVAQGLLLAGILLASVMGVVRLVLSAGSPSGPVGDA